MTEDGKQPKELLNNEIDLTPSKRPNRSNYKNDDDYHKAWVHYYGKPGARTEDQFKLLVKDYGVKDVAFMEKMSIEEVRHMAGLGRSFKSKIKNLRKAK